MTTTPVIFIIFNRPAKAKLVFEAIRAVRPSRLLVVSDGPRLSRPGEASLVDACRDLVKEVDWPCVVEIDFATTNLGCRDRLQSGLNWAFARVERAIVLEDDCVPSRAFFDFCEHMLDQFKGIPQVTHICGSNPFGAYGSSNGQLNFWASRYFFIWGWATWSERWFKHYRHENSLSIDAKMVQSLAHVHGPLAWYWLWILYKVRYGRLNTWDHQWSFGNWLAGSASIVPQYNLVRNIGFDGDATHTTASAERKVRSYDPRELALGRLLPFEQSFDFRYSIQIVHDVLDQIGRRFSWNELSCC